MAARIVALLLVLALGGAVAAAGPAAAGRWALPKAEAEKWAERVRQLTPPGWTVSTRGNDLVIGRDKHVRFAGVEINAPAVPTRTPMDLREGTYRLTLRFASRMGSDEYDKLAAANAAADRERERLSQAVGLPHKFDEIIATTPEERERVRAYREAVKKLRWHALPDLYTPEYSVYLYLPSDGLSYIYDQEAAAECRAVQEAVLRYFGMYDPKAAATGQEVGQPGPPSEP